MKFSQTIANFPHFFVFKITVCSSSLLLYVTHCHHLNLNISCEKMALSDCAVCSDKLQLTENRIECYGFCGKKFHFSCISKSNKAYKKHVMTLLIEIANFQWYCDDCIPYTINGTYSGILKNINSCVNVLTTTVNEQQLDNGSISTFTTQLTSPINGISPVQPIQTQIQTQFQTGFQDFNNQNVNTTDIQSKSSDSVANTSNTSINSINMASDDLSNADSVTVCAKRKLSPSKENVKRRKSNVHSPSQGSHLGDFVAVNKTQIDTIDKAENSRCIYVTPFKPTTDSSEIISHLKSFGFIREFADKINCVKLISDKVNQSKLSFVSFKLFVPDEFYNLVADKSIWPQGISVKDFETRSKNQTKPQQKNQNPFRRKFNSTVQKNLNRPKLNFHPKQRKINQILTHPHPHYNQSAYSMMNYPMMNQPLFNPQMMWNIPTLQNQNQFHRNAQF